MEVHNTLHNVIDISAFPISLCAIYQVFHALSFSNLEPLSYLFQLVFNFLIMFIGSWIPSKGR